MQKDSETCSIGRASVQMLFDEDVFPQFTITVLNC